MGSWGPNSCIIYYSRHVPLSLHVSIIAAERVKNTTVMGNITLAWWLWMHLGRICRTWNELEFAIVNIVCGIQMWKMRAKKWMMIFEMIHTSRFSLFMLFYLIYMSANITWSLDSAWFLHVQRENLMWMNFEAYYKINTVIILEACCSFFLSWGACIYSKVLWIVNRSWLVS